MSKSDFFLATIYYEQPKPCSLCQQLTTRALWQTEASTVPTEWPLCDTCIRSVVEVYKADFQHRHPPTGRQFEQAESR
jgi:hypothetical protein